MQGRGHCPWCCLSLPLSHACLLQLRGVKEVYDYCPLVEFNTQCSQSPDGNKLNDCFCVFVS